MRSFDGLREHPRLLIMAVVVLLAAHGLVFYLVRHLVLSATLASCLIMFIVLKHLGILGAALACLRRPSGD